MLPFDLEDWLANEGDKTVHKIADLGFSNINVRERVLYEVWLFDTERRNGGVSQYFCNRGRNQWASLCELAKILLPSFETFAIKVNHIIAHSADAYHAIIESEIDLDAQYDECRVQLITALRLATTGTESS